MMEAILAKILAEGNLVSSLLTAAVVYLWRELAGCRRNHLDCERKNLLLAQAIDDLAEGRIDEGKAKAMKIVETAKAEILGK